MTREAIRQHDLAAPLPHDDLDPGPTRRTFLRGAGRKAVFVTPVVMTLAASTTRAGSGWDSDCIEKGSATTCTVNEDCCPPLTCTGGVCND